MDTGRVLMYGIRGALIAFIMAAIAVAVLITVFDGQDVPYPPLFPWIFLVAAPVAGFIQGAAISIRQQVGQRMAPQTRLIVGGIMLLVLVAFNGVGFMMTERGDAGINGVDACEPTPWATAATGNLTVRLSGAGLVIPVVTGDASGESGKTSPGAFSAMELTPAWSGDETLAVTLSVAQNGEWLHGGSHETVRSGQPLDFSLPDPEYDGFRVAMSTGPMADDLEVTVAWKTLHRTVC